MALVHAQEGAARREKGEEEEEGMKRRKEEEEDEDKEAEECPTPHKSYLKNPLHCIRKVKKIFYLVI